MNAPQQHSLLGDIEMAPRDPILGITEAYNADVKPNKVNLGVGVYCDDNGKIPLLECVRRAEEEIVKRQAPRGYLPIDGLGAFNEATRKLVFGEESQVVACGQVVTIQALGGTGALKVGADFLRRFFPGSQVYISDPSWENHRALFEAAGFPVNTYPYYDAATHGLNFSGMLSALASIPPGSIVVLHACCHNPTGVDPDGQQWEQIIAAVRNRGLIPFLDIAYQGFGTGIDEDASVVRRFAATRGAMFVASSFSKSFSLYGERVGALSVVAASKEEASTVLSQVKRLVRSNYSSPPNCGGQIVSTVLRSAELRSMWEVEVAGMRERIRAMRVALVEKLRSKVTGADFHFVMQQRGMFSYSGLSAEAVKRLRTEFSVYAVDTGRICVAALNSKNIDNVVDAVAHLI